MQQMNQQNLRGQNGNISYLSFFPVRPNCLILLKQQAKYVLFKVGTVKNKLTSSHNFIIFLNPAFIYFKKNN